MSHTPQGHIDMQTETYKVLSGAHTAAIDFVKGATANDVITFALEQPARDKVTEVQTDSGIWKKQGDTFVFVSWSELDNSGGTFSCDIAAAECCAASFTF